MFQRSLHVENPHKRNHPSNISRRTLDITGDGRLINHSSKRRKPSSRACHCSGFCGGYRLSRLEPLSLPISIPSKHRPRNIEHTSRAPRHEEGSRKVAKTQRSAHIWRLRVFAAWRLCARSCECRRRQGDRLHRRDGQQMSSVPQFGRPESINSVTTHAQRSWRPIIPSEHTSETSGWIGPSTSPTNHRPHTSNATIRPRNFLTARTFEVTGRWFGVVERSEQVGRNRSGASSFPHIFLLVSLNFAWCSSAGLVAMFALAKCPVQPFLRSQATVDELGKPPLT